MKSCSLFLIPVFVIIGCASSAELQRPGAQGYDPPVADHCFNFSRLSPGDRVQADSLLQYALENEALHTLVSTLKPMSDVVSYRWIIEETDTLETSGDVSINRIIEFTEEIEQIGRIASSFSCGPLAAAVFPFRNVYDGKRYVQFRVYRTDSMDQMIGRNREFWSRWAFVEGSRPEVIISVMEYEDRLDRFRGYGYLYGYPEHAVNFFVEAARAEEETGIFTERDFIHMPVASEEEGRFVYAVEKGADLTEADHRIEEKAQENVDLYLERIEAYRNQNGEIDAVSFLRDFYMEMGWIQHNQNRNMAGNRR